MKDTEFQSIDPLVDKVDEVVSHFFDSEQCRELKEAVQQASGLLKNKSVTVNLTFEVFDSERERGLTLLDTGLASSGGEEPYRCHADAATQRYVMEGEIGEVPNDHCPKCWNIWDVKDGNPMCQVCGITLGDDIKILLDSDDCPHCGEGKVSMANPVCAKCGYQVDLDIVAWG